MEYFIKFAAIIACICVSSGERKKFNGYQLLSFDVKSEDDLTNLKLLTRVASEVDFWRGPGLGWNNAVLVGPEDLAAVKIVARGLGLPFEVEHDDIESLVARQYQQQAEKRVYKRVQGGDVVDHTNFHNLTTYMDYLDQLQAVYPHLMDIETLGKETYKGNKVKVVKLHAPKRKKEKSEKKVIIVEAGIHCREWAATSSALYVIEKILQGFEGSGHDLEIELMLEMYDWWIVPNANPDGYAHTHDAENGHRFWRKNLRPIPRENKTACIGVDLNRNFDYEFGTTGVDPTCDLYPSIYPGPFGFSEAETQNLRDLALSAKHRLEAYFSTHAYSQLLLKPWAYYRGDDNPHPNHKEYDRVGKLMVEDMVTIDNKAYAYGTPYDVLGYAASGGSIDWVADTWKSAYVYCIEMRPAGRHGFAGFALPREEIVAAGGEMLAALRTMALNTKYAIGEKQMIEDIAG